ncbi:LON peptidase substrate-binding domain-containing protein [Novipirellula artificiosorum]|uniref:Lon protease n=1 Tax=Novipirellula artificiosorum TaxID=2528016 RepID=A0A5C6D855_9BACT|nr:LON peptidase substrate-binding domain-containing protein [Novipirellula artificiosorum]TWU32275.1 Lon protease [Novipirellula artificiosorum]
MNDLDDVMQLPDDFDGRVRLFPLPDLVLFPHAMQPLHIFEPRYCEMLTESLSSDRLIAMATLTGGISAVKADSPPIATTVCIGRILSHAELENDRHNLLLVGTKRATIIRELDTGRSFRTAEVEVHPDIYPPAGAESRREVKKKLLEAFATVIPPSQQATQSLTELMAGQMGLGPITDIISYTLPFEVQAKLRLLNIANVDERAIELIELLRSGTVQLSSVSIEEQSGDAGSGGNPPFPPPFSLN